MKSYINFKLALLQTPIFSQYPEKPQHSFNSRENMSSSKSRGIFRLFLRREKADWTGKRVEVT